ncbi:MAG TPA: hypothetical protein PKW06_03330 [Cyclobacteriaceae bacterium]|nr:hypothetical protein [Cyclobacteriaceae bacterium]
MTVLLLSIGFIGLFFILMSVRLLFVKDGQFRGTCASQSPWLVKEEATCGYCGKTLGAGEACGNPDKAIEADFPQIKRQ